ncbi:MAG: TadE/TadG family type IV pilus assembly protein [Geminicoccales bacterium]
MLAPLISSFHRSFLFINKPTDKKPGYGGFFLVHKVWRSLRNDRANVAVEFALALPVLLLMLLASAELGRFVLLHQKVDRVAVTISDLVARAETISESDLDDIFNAAGQVAEPFDLAGRGRVVVSSVINDDGDGATIAWQRTSDGSFSASSEIGTEGGSATLPDDFNVLEGETAIISEVFFDFEPFLSSLIVASQVLYRRAHHRPRLGTLDTIETG